MQILVAALFPAMIGLRRFTAPRENAWYTPRVWWQIMLLSVLYALSGVFLHQGAGLAFTACLPRQMYTPLLRMPHSLMKADVLRPAHRILAGAG